MGAKMEWISVNAERPKIGQNVILFSNGVVQQDIYMYDQGDINDYEVSTFWSRDDLDECPILKDDDMWIPFPSRPSSSNSDYAKCPNCGSTTDTDVCCQECLTKIAERGN